MTSYFPQHFHDPDHLPPPPRRWRSIVFCAVFLCAVFVFWLFRAWSGRDPVGDKTSTTPPAEVVAPAVVPPAVPSPKLVEYGFPTAQRNLMTHQDATVYMPTGSGRVESAWYGSVRTRQQGSALLPAFHEGIDIAPLKRDRQGKALDEVFAAADGKVAYANRVGGNSSYGAYVVLIHDDPIGPVYTLYAHLGSVASIKVGQSIKRGEIIGVMGHSSNQSIPVQRAHLHFEIGLVINRRFLQWYRTQKLTPEHAEYHGWNLTGINPMVLYTDTSDTRLFSMSHHLLSLKPAFSLVASAKKRPDFFRMYPSLWEGGEAIAGGVVLYVGEGGVILRGRSATPEEISRLGRASALVLNVDRQELGRNGQRLILERGGSWSLGSNGTQWLEILTY